VGYSHVTKFRRDPRSRRRIETIDRLAALTKIVRPVIGKRIRDRVGAIHRRKIAGLLPRLLGEPCSRPLFGLCKADHGAAIRVAGTGGRTLPLIMLAPSVVADPGNPSPAFGPLTVPKRASLRQHSPVRLATDWQSRASRSRVDLRVPDGAGHSSPTP